MKEYDISSEVWREYDLPDREVAYRINAPSKLYLKEGGTTHRVVDEKGIVHCVPAPGFQGCVLRWKPKKSNNPVEF